MSNKLISSKFLYDKLGYAALNVTDLDRSIKFYVELMGLELVSSESGIAYLRCSEDHHDLVLYEALTPGLKRVAFKLSMQEDLDSAFVHFESAKLSPSWLSEEECRELNQGPTFRVREPNSTLCLEFYESMLFMALPYKPTTTKIERIGHVVLGIEKYLEATELLESTFNFLPSDVVKDKFTWMRCFPNPLHHSLAMGASNRNHLHHVNFMVTDIDDIGKAVSRLKKAGVDIVFGPGRHLPSTSIFLYFLDPDGMTMEFSFGMELIDEKNNREPRMLEMHPNTMDIWGSAPDERFGKHGVIEGAPD